jgi:hypothetical protein
MAARWETFDKMIRELGAVRIEVDALAGTAVESAPEARRLREALSLASEAVHRCLDEDGEDAVVAAWRAIAGAQEAHVRATRTLEMAKQARDDVRTVRSRAARQREEARRWQRAAARSGEAPSPVPSEYDGPDADGAADEDPDAGDDR